MLPGTVPIETMRKYDSSEDVLEDEASYSEGKSKPDKDSNVDIPSKRSFLDFLLCRRKPPSLKNNLAVVGLRNALLVGMISNVEDTEEASTQLEAKAKLKDLPLKALNAREYQSNPKTATTSSTMPQEKKVTTLAKTDLQRADSAQQYCSYSTSSNADSSIGSMSSSGDISTPPDIQVEAIAEGKEATNPTDASFATQMFARDAPRLTAKELLAIPLTVPPINTPPPKLTYSINALKGQSLKKRTYMKGRSNINILSSSDETLVDPTDPQVIVTGPGEKFPEIVSDDSSMQRRFSYQPSSHSRADTKALHVLSEQAKNWLQRAYSLNVADCDQTEFFSENNLKHCQSSSLPGSSKPTTPLKRQTTLQVPNSGNFLAVPSESYLQVPFQKHPSVSPSLKVVTENTKQNEIRAKRRLRARQLKRQKSIDTSGSVEMEVRKLSLRRKSFALCKNCSASVPVPSHEAIPGHFVTVSNSAAVQYKNQDPEPKLTTCPKLQMMVHMPTKNESLVNGVKITSL